MEFFTTTGDNENFSFIAFAVFIGLIIVTIIFISSLALYIFEQLFGSTQISSFSEKYLEPTIPAFSPLLAAYLINSGSQTTKFSEGYQLLIYLISLVTAIMLFTKNRRAVIEKYSEKKLSDSRLIRENDSLKELNELAEEKMIEIKSSLVTLNREVKNNSHVQESIDSILKKKQSRFDEKLTLFKDMPSPPRKREVFEQITQPEAQLKTILESFAPQLKSILRTKGKCRILLARLCQEDGEFKQIACFPEEDSLIKTINKYPKREGLFGKCRTTINPQIINDIEDEIKKIKRDNGYKGAYLYDKKVTPIYLQSGSILGLRKDSGEKSPHSDLYLSIHCKEKDIFVNENIDLNFLYTNALIPLMESVLIEYKLFKLKNL